MDLEDIDEEEYERLQQVLLESMNDGEVNEIDADEAEASGMLQNAVNQIAQNYNQLMNNQDQEDEKKEEEKEEKKG